jgi:hypothetical protein
MVKSQLKILTERIACQQNKQKKRQLTYIEEGNSDHFFKVRRIR